MLQAWLSIGYIVLLALLVLAFILWRREAPVLAIAALVVGIGTVIRTTVFEFYDSHDGARRVVAKRVLLFAISKPIIPACDAQCRSVPRSWFAIWFANSSPN
jgi:hypothetical protein